jgi:hypothetical protein
MAIDALIRNLKTKTKKNLVKKIHDIHQVRTLLDFLLIKFGKTRLKSHPITVGSSMRTRYSRFFLLREEN